MSKLIRASLDQLTTLADFMENHPALAQGTMKSLEGRNTAKRLYHQLSLSLNALNGAKKSPRGWARFWADKKFAIKKAMLESSGGANLSPVDSKIYDICFVRKEEGSKNMKSVKKESDCDYSPFEEDNDDKSLGDVEVDGEGPTITFEEQPMIDVDERQADLMEKLVNVMGEQSTALSQLAQASQLQARAVDRLADASIIQARALERLAGAFENIGASFVDVRNSIVGIDNTMKRFYNTPHT